jgi:voltage-gated sodium channel
MRKLSQFLITDTWIISLILLNTIVLFIDSFDTIKQEYLWLDTIDFIINILFFVEMFLKIRINSWTNYIKDPWNLLDFSINIMLVPSILLFFLNEPNFLFLTILRLVRIAKFFRFFKFVPNIERIFLGIIRALKASVFIVLAFFLYLLIMSVISCYFFKTLSPEHFGDPIVSMYSTFKVFTIEGWFELPELLTANMSTGPAFLVKIYFIFLVLSGGVCGISLINAIFVDEMVADNNDQIIEKLNHISKEIQELKEKVDK